MAVKSSSDSQMIWNKSKRLLKQHVANTLVLSTY